MKTRVPLGFLITALLGLSAGTAHANTCVELDLSQDRLNPNDQPSAKAMLEQTISNLGVPVAREGCTQFYRVYHIPLGTTVNVFMAAPQGNRQGQANRIEELPAVYDQLVRSLLSGQPQGTYNQTVTRQNVTQQQAAPMRVNADSVKYMRLGYGGIMGPDTPTGVAIGFGYRYELDAIGIDVSFLNFIFGTDSEDKISGATGSWVKLMGLWYADPYSNTSWYAGGGISWGLTALYDGVSDYSGSGLQAEGALGFEFLRASSIRLFTQLDVSLPMYQIDRIDGTGDKWAPIFSLSLGLGWGQGINRVAVIM